jgi:hypothetical protein
MSYYEQTRKDAREAMGNLIKQTVDDNLDDMVKAKAYVKNHAENAMECAKADLYFVSYVWAYHECGAHEAMHAAVKGV